MSKTRTLFGALVVVSLSVAVLAPCACSPFQAGNCPSLLYFRVANCPYCKQMTPVVEEIEQEYGKQIDVVYAEVDQQQGKDLAKHHGIIGYPTILLLDSEGERVGLLRGVVPYSSLKKMVNDVLQGGS